MKLILCFYLVLSLTGCADNKNLLNLLFPSSLAIDYKDGHYEIAFQIDNFNSIAKTELEISNEKTRLLVTTGRGKTIEEAVVNIEQQERSIINFSHIKSIILRPNALEPDILKHICNYVSFNQELRMDSEVYYTENDYKELYSTSFQVSRSQLYILINSSEFQRVSMIMNTVNLMQLTKSLEESGVTIHIPILKVTDTQETYITEDGEQQQKIYDIQEIMYLNQDEQHKISINNLEGVQWIRPHQNAVEINIVDDKGELSAYSSRVNSYIFYNPKDKKYYLKGNANIVITRDTAFRSIEEIEPLVTKKVHDQIMHTYLEGIENDTDIYNIYYQSLCFGDNTILTKDNFINDLDVNIHIKGSYVGAY